MPGTVDAATRLEESIRNAPDGMALVPYLTAGLPSKDEFAETLLAITDVADAVEIGVPFTDPVADGATIQQASRRALEAGVTLEWTLDVLERLPRAPGCPLVLMSYLNPLLAFGFERLAARCQDAHVAGWIIPDLPLEEGRRVGEIAGQAGLGRIQLVTPLSDDARTSELVAASRGFVYAVTVAGTTGGRSLDAGAITSYLDRVRAVSSGRPVCAGFGIRSAEQVDTLRGHVDGVIVGSALLEHLNNPVEFLTGLRSRNSP